MPELPEVETVRRGLAPVMDAARLIKVEQRRPDLRFPFPKNFAERLAGARITTLGRRAKYLTAPLSTGETLIMHLGMSGRFSVSGATPLAAAAFHFAAPANPAHDHVVFHCDTGATVTFNDPRRFGYMDLADTDTLEMCKHFDTLGPEPLSNHFAGPALHEALSKTRTAVKSALLNQRVVAGVGNIYACEALHAAQLRPDRPGRTINGDEADRLASAVKSVLARAIEAGGSSLRDHAGVDGALGYFQHEFAVYGRAGKPCPRPGCPGVIARMVQTGRSTFYCPDCQF